MSGIARILLARGVQVSGSDAKDSRTVLALRAQGARVAVGHDASNLDQLVGGPTEVVVSTAIKESNPEYAAARERGITVLRRAEALAALMEDHRVVCVAGTHGKTSTTSMLTVALQHCRLDPSFAIGGDLNESGANAHQGTGGVFVAEADESRRLVPVLLAVRRRRDERRSRPPRPPRHRRGLHGRVRLVPGTDRARRRAGVLCGRSRRGCG